MDMGRSNVGKRVSFFLRLPSHFLYSFQTAAAKADSRGYS
jgi:hypothetical protein